MSPHPLAGAQTGARPSTIIERKSLHNELLARLREMIVEGDLRPGEKIPENTLCERFGVSRTPLRESLKALAAEGLVSLLPNRGAIVTVITRTEIDELFPIIGALEALAGERVCNLAKNSTLKRFRALHNQMVSQFNSGDESAYRQTNRKFHELLFEVAENQALRNLYQTLIVRTHAARFIIRKDIEDWADAIKDHANIVDALEKRESLRVAQLLKQHLTETATRVSHRFIERARPYSG